MALFKTQSAAVYGIDAHRIDVEVDMYSYGSPRDSRMVGMPDVAVRESRERIKSALINSGFGYPPAFDHSFLQRSTGIDFGAAKVHRIAAKATHECHVGTQSIQCGVRVESHQCKLRGNPQFGTQLYGTFRIFHGLVSI
jgi:hypothetical protein